MRKPEQSAEPSIEEILASIRKIIADDGTQPTARADALSETPPVPTQRRIDPEQSRRPFQPTAAFYPEPEEPVAALGEDDILELTEDSMVEDDGGQGGMSFADAAAHPETRQPRPESVQAAIAGISRSMPPSGEELESVFSSVVAEVHRLAGGGQAPVAAASEQDWAEPVATAIPKAPRQHSPAPWDPVAEDAGSTSQPPQPKAPPPPSAAEPWAGMAPEMDVAPKPAARAPQTAQRQASKPVWSARHLDGEGPRARAPQQPAVSKLAAQTGPTVRPNMTGPEGWAEGVQMPVPEGGPATPFPEPDFDSPDVAPPLSGSSDVRPEIEKEKTFVGEMLTRVFGGSQKKAPEMPQAADPRSTQPRADARQAKAEDLAKATIADFASDKLRAPSVAEALHADKPFMDAITDSLAMAMAEVEAEHKEDHSLRSVIATAAEELELPEMPFPPDVEIFGAPHAQSPASSATPEVPSGRQSAPAAPSRSHASSFADPPELSRFFSEAGQNADPSHAEIFGSSPEAERAPPALRPAPKSDPVVSTPSAPGTAFPAGLEDSIKELIKPLIVQWLNENLPRIVEKAVREEIAGHELVSRARGESGSRH